MGDRLLSFLSLGKVFEWPPGPVSKLLSRSSKLEAMPKEVLALLKTQGVIGEHSEAKSTFLRWTDFSSSEKSLDFGGDLYGGFRARRSDICSACLLKRYLASRRASSRLFDALKQGAEVELERGNPPPFEQEEQGVWSWDKEGWRQELALPVPGCQHCWPYRGPLPPLGQGHFQPVRQIDRSGLLTQAALPEILWLSGHSTVGGGASWHEDERLAEHKARNEALERYAAHFERSLEMSNHQGQTRAADPQKVFLTRVGSVSTGLACRESLTLAREDGLREVCERHALAQFWLRVDAGEEAGRSLEQMETQGAEIHLLQIDSPHRPTVVASGTDGEGRRFFGSACSELPLAKEKARLEALHNLSLLSRMSPPQSYSVPQSFEEHAQYYWWQPQLFPEVVLGQDSSCSELAENDIWWVDITTEDIKLYGLWVLRVLVQGFLHTPLSHRDWGELTSSPPSRPHPFA